MYKLLLIENNLEARDRIHEALTASGLKLSLTEVGDCAAALTLFEHDSFDCLVLESSSKHKTLAGAMKNLIRDPLWPAIPIILLANEPTPKLETELSDLGAWDILNRDYFTLAQFNRTLKQAISHHRMDVKIRLGNKELVKLRRQAKTSADRRAIGELAADIGHDFNNLLTSILGHLRIAAHDKISKDAEAHLKSATDLVLRGADLTEDLLVFSQKQNPTFRVVEPNDLVKGVDYRVKRLLGSTISLDHRLSIKRLRIFVDPLEFENTLVALVENSCEAIPEFGTINITVSQCDVDGKQQGEKKFKPGRYVLFTIKDSGNGMSRAVLKKALDPKFTTKKVSDGAGMGLSNVANFVEQAKGHMKIESKRGEGTTVKLFIPPSKRTEEREAYSKATEGALDINGKGQTILLVEDDISVLNVVALALKAKNYKVLTAEDAEEAFEIILTAKNLDMLVTDVILPNNLSGKDVAVKFHHRFPENGIIYCSGYHEDEVRKKITLGPEGEVISKPYEVSTLLIKMARILQKK